MTKHKSNKPHSIIMFARADNDHGTEGVGGFQLYQPSVMKGPNNSIKMGGHKTQQQSWTQKFTNLKALMYSDHGTN